MLAIHMILLPNKKLMIMNRSRPGESIDYEIELIAPPYTSAGHTFVPIHESEVRELFCAGHTLDEDGNVIFAGGHDESLGPNHGLKDTWLYKWNEGTYGTLTKMSDMTNGRWYPSLLQLADRSIMSLMGLYCQHHPSCSSGFGRNNIPDLWTAIPGSSNPTHHLEALTQRSMDLYYPHVFIHPVTGQPFFAAKGNPGIGEGFEGQSAIYNIETCAWADYAVILQTLANVKVTYPSGVMMDGVVYRSGGSVSDLPQHEAVKSTVKIDLKQTSPAWVQVDDMVEKRKNHTFVALPDGRILAMGGNLNGEVDGSILRTQPEAYDTEASNPTWTSLQEVPSGVRIGRGYHSTALLLPDASVVFAGGEVEGTHEEPWVRQRRAQFFTPEYGGDSDWQDTRPEISPGSEAPRPPDSMRYGEQYEFNIVVAEGRELAKVRLISLGATTHAFNQNQQFVTLSFEPHPSEANTYIVTAPASPIIATPGFYMFFALDDERVPSVAHIVQLKDFTRAFPHTVTLSSGTAWQTTPVLTEVVLADNKYLGSVLYSDPQDPSIASILAEASVSASTYTKVRLTVEMRTSISTDYAWYLWNYDTSAYVQVKSGTLGTADTTITHTVSSTGSSPYVSSTGQVKALLDWRDLWSNAFDVFVDKIEFGVR